jgi:chlorobactene glucosyltransferase
MAAIPSFNPQALAILYSLAVLLVWTRRIFWMWRFRRVNPPLVPLHQSSTENDKVSVIVPARNEEKNIARCLFHLFKQNYKNFEIIVVNDRSTDRTGHLLDNFKSLSPVPFRIVQIEKLPPGWTGKNHAMVAGSKAATGDWLLFTDADTTHRPASVRTSLTWAAQHGIDLLTLAPETECHSFWEKTVQPLAVSSLALWFDTTKINDPNNKRVLANGQFILVKKAVYQNAGTNEAVKDQVVEDVEFAKKVRQAGYNVKFLNGTELYATRMYSSLGEIKNGWTRIFTYLFEKNVWAILHKVLLFLAFSILPFVLMGIEAWLYFAHSPVFDPAVYGISLGACLWIILIRFFGNEMLKCDPKYAFLHPLGSLVMVWIMLACVGRVVFRLPSVWRGDAYR